MINDNSKPLILIGSNLALFYIKDVCQNFNIKIEGILDHDYYGNTVEIEGVPVIGTEQWLEDPEKLKNYCENYNFFLATNYLPANDPTSKRNVEKRFKLMDMIDRLNLPCISLIDKGAFVHDTCIIGKNVFIETFSYLAGYNTIGDYSSIYAFSITGHHNTIGRNCILQRKSGVYDYDTIEDNVFIGMNSQIAGESVTIRKGTVIHSCMVVRRSTSENETVSLVGKDLRKIYHMPAESD
jgi:carbonic anhydrase/acetyltransferase-like protein (isoleucine patch superfamily)